MGEERHRKGFFDLPAELRNSIYELAFPCANNTSYNPVLTYRKVKQCECFGQPLARVSRQMRNETLAFFYSIHEFQFMMFSLNKPLLEEWVNNGPGDYWIRSIRRIQLKGYYQVKVLHWLSIFGETTVDLNLPDATVTSMYYVHEAFNPKVIDEANKKVEQIAQSLPCVDGRRTLTKEKLLEIFDAIGFH